MRAAKNVSKRMTWVMASLVLLFSQITPVVLSTARAGALGGDVPSNPACTALYGSPCITADKSDYSPTDTIVITGYGFVAGTQYSLAIQSSTGNYNATSIVTADAAGVIGVSQTLDGVYRPNYTATASDLLGNVIATTNFTDSRLINSATVDGSSSTTVSSGATVAVVVNVTTNGSGTDDDWECTGWSIAGGSSGTSTGINISSDATTNHSFNVTAPSTPGSYSITFTAYSNNGCSQGASTPLTLTNGITVTSPITITSVTVDGSASPSVDPAEVVPVVVNATVATGMNWRSTEWRIDNGNWTCEDTANKTAGNQSVSFNITAPIALGAHTLDVRAYSDDGSGNGCDDDQSGTFTLANSVNVTVVANPVLMDSCGLDIALVIDSSSSIDSTELTQMKAAYVAFLNAFLPATSTQFSVTDFDTTASVVQSFTANLATLTTAVNSPTSGGYTNWQDGLLKAQSTFDPRPAKQNLVIFASDGNPNTIGNGPAGNASEPVAVNAAVGVANSLKSSGTRVMALGIGDGLDVANLKAISGPVADAGVNSDVITSGFGTLAADLANLAKQLCGGTITAQKVIDADGNLQTTNDQTPFNGWGFDVDGSPSNPAANQTGADGYTPSVKVENGTYGITEAASTSYNLLSANCTGATNNGVINGNSVTGIVVGTDQIVSCKFINTPKPATLIVNKVLKNDNGGTKTVTQFSYKVNNGSAVPFNANGSNSQTVAPGTYNVTEVAAPGYATTYDGCSNVQIANGETKTCTITNDDIAPALTLVKNLVKNNGGTAVATDWLLKATGPSTISGQGGVVSGASFKAGNYTLSESGGPTGYTASAWNCTGNGTQNGAVISLELAQSATCTITNDDDAAGLTLVKNLVDQYNSGAAKTDWTLTATGPTVISGAGGATSSTVSAGTYNLAESGPTAGFDASAWDCGNANIVGTTLQIALGQQVTCSITNTSQPAKLIVKKVVVNDNGGKLQAENFNFKVNGGGSVAFEADGQNDLNNLPKGTYTIVENEANQNGYTTTYDGCTSVAINNGETKTCVVTNNDVAPTLTVKKKAINDNGGTKLSNEFLLYANGNQLTGGTTATNGNATTTTYTVTGVSATSYELSEDADDAYTATDWTCTGNSSALDGSTVTLKLGENVVCEITNNDDTPSLTLIKKVVDKFGYGAVASDWTLTATGPTNLSGAGGVAKTNVKAGDYTLGETTQEWASKYWDSEWSCAGGSELASQALTIALAQNVTCTVTNTMKGGTIIVHKEVINDDEGTSTAGDFSVNVNGGASQNFVEDVDNELLGQTTFYVPGNHTYAITEDQDTEDSGYFTVYENDCDSDSYSKESYDENCFPGDCEEVYVGIGETVNCYITNDDEGEGDGPNVDLVVNKDDGGAIAQANGSYNYTLDVYNNVNTTAATNVVLTDVIPNTLKVNSVDDGDWTCAVAGADADGYGGTLTCTLPSLAGSTSADTITLNVTVKAGTTGSIYNTVTVVSDCPDNNSDDNTDTEETPVMAIKVVKSGPASANVGDTVTYTFTVTNPGSVPLSGVTVSDNIAGAGKYQSGDVNANNLLDQDETWVYTANYKIPNGTNKVDNTATACGAFIQVVQIPSILSRIASIALPTATTAPVCDDDTHSLTVNQPLADTGTPIVLTSVIAFAMLTAALYLALPQKRAQITRK